MNSINEKMKESPLLDMIRKLSFNPRRGTTELNPLIAVVAAVSQSRNLEINVIGHLIDLYDWRDHRLRSDMAIDLEKILLGMVES